MTLQEGIKLQGTPALIPSCSRDALPQFLVDIGCEVGAEIGVYKGGFTEKFCKVGLKMFAIDPWESFRGQGRTQRVQDRQNFLYEHTCRTLAPYIQDGICTIIRKTSMDAVKDFKNSSLDFVYIDGNHVFSYVAQDIYEWGKIVKSGGVVSGHDYYNTIPQAHNVLCHVGVVVDAYTKLYDIQNWWIFGRSKPIEEEYKDDRSYSWMWISR